jgi:hypothetical protein
MLRSRLAAAATVAVVVFGFGVAGPAFADGATGTTSTTEARPVVTNAGSSYTVSLPGVGSLTFTVDPATGAVSNVVATAAGTFTAGTPTTTDEGVQVTFTGTDGTVKLLQADVDAETGEPVTVKAEVDTHKPCPTTTPATGTTPTTADDGEDCDPPEATEPPKPPKPAETSEKSEKAEKAASPDGETDHGPSSQSADGGGGD